MMPANREANMDLPMPEIVNLLSRAFPKVQGIYIYGSTSGGTAGPASDVDLAVLSPEKIPDAKRFEIAQSLAAKIKQEVDLVDLRQTPTVFQFQVVTSGNLLKAQDPAACGRFEDLVYRSYMKLNEERAAILKDVQSRGKVF